MNDLTDRVSVRHAIDTDATLISVLASATFYEAYFEQDESSNLSGYIHESFAVDEVRSQLQDPESSYILIFLDGKAVGYARLIENATSDGISPGSTIELRRLYMLERVWGTGIGTTLLEYCVDEGRNRGFDIFWLGVWEENERAIRFYDKFGFSQVGTISFPYGDVVGTNRVLQRFLK